jgi:hypothetical protein
MKTLLFLIISTFLSAETIVVQEGLERAIARYKSDACSMAKAQARKKYEVVDMDPGCRCERTDAREWQCDIEFTYKRMKGEG